MLIPPLAMKIWSISPSEGINMRLWIPLFILWPLLLILALALTPLVIILALLLWPWGKARQLILFLPLFFYLAWATRGLLIDVRNAGKWFLISIK